MATSNISTMTLARVVRHDAFCEILTKQKGQRSVRPPAKKNKKGHPEESELDTEIDCLPFCQSIWRGWRVEKVSKHVTNEIHHGDSSIRCERDDGK